ncbi:MAG: lysine--tRNA ligase, partial [Anaerolineaceae bacterium]|nr:lysine--tRNA ligase [Anaerolineaceae bacterium]
MERSDLEKIRLEKAERLRKAGMDPYPTRSHVTHTAQAALETFDNAEAAGSTEPVTVTVAGRLRAMRPMGKLTFAHIEDSTGRIQLFLRVNDLGEEKFKLFNEEFDLGDILEASGTLFRTRTGEITVNVSSFAML